MARTFGSYMLQPTKDEIRQWLSEARTQLKHERSQRRLAEYRLGVATRKLGQLVLEGKIAISADTLGELVIRIASDEELGIERTGSESIEH